MLPPLDDHWRDTLALIAAASRDDGEGISAILGAANTRAVAGMATGVCLYFLAEAGIDASEWAAAGLADARRAT